MYTVSKFRTKDKDTLHKICKETSAFDLKNRNAEEFLYLMYNDYYTENESDFCFVALDNNNRAVGYIICSVDFNSYKKLFNKLYFPKIKKLGLKYTFMAICEILVHGIFSFKYKTHIHINLTKSCRQQGVGTMLMNTLKKELLKNDIHCILLSCSSSNKPAVSFYKKNGFKIILKVPGTNVMVCKF